MPAAAALELTFLGHQTWHISDGDAVVLLDPILTPAFGAGRLEFTIWPPRTVDAAAMLTTSPARPISAPPVSSAN